jgi:integrase
VCREFQAFAAWATNQDYFAADPIQHIKGLKVDAPDPKLISDDQFTDLLNNVPMWLREIVWVDWLIGVRLANVVSLRYDQVHIEDEDNLYIEFAPSEMKKGNATRIDLSDLPELVDWFRIRRLAHPSDPYVWMSPSFKDGFGHFSLSYVGKRFSRAAKELGVNATFHSIRHTFATRWAESGMDLHSLSKLLAHKDMNSTKRYVHVEDVNLQRIAKKKVARVRKVPELRVVNSK